MKKNSIRAAAVSTILMGALTFGVLSAPVASAAPAPSNAPSTIGAVVPASSQSDSFAKQTFDLMNAKRASAGVKPLVWNQKVADVSQAWSEHLGRATMDPNFDWANIHRPDAGGSLIPSGSSMYREIIGFNLSPAQIVDWWMNSATHKAAMLHPNLTDAGIGYVVPTSGPYAGWHLVVSNLAAYATTTPVTPTYAFTDIADTGFATEITWMKTKGITNGYADGTFRPYDTVNRDQMAAFLYRLGDSPAYTPPAVSPFSDVPTSHAFYKEITWMRAVGISTGWSDGTFRPGDKVSREQMAAFMYRFTTSACNVQKYPSRDFVDANTSAFSAEIKWMGGAGISTGWADGTYRPFNLTLRQEMAAFVYRLSNFIDANGGCWG